MEWIAHGKFGNCHSLKSMEGDEGFKEVIVSPID